MNILWIEDFGGLSAGKNILNQMFANLLSFEAWDNKKLSLISRPADLNEFCSQQNSLHTIYLCRHYFDYENFKNKHSILNEIDLIITDIRLDNLDDEAFDLPIPESYSDKIKFHENAGFFIFNDLIYLGFPESKMCFMTGEKNSLKDFSEKCSEIYMPKVTPFEKTDADYEKLRDWIKEKETGYSKLRRGVIAGCRDISKNLTKESLNFNGFINESEKQVNLEDMRDYLGVLENFFPLREPSDKKQDDKKPSDKENIYKLFIRTLTHEWEATEPKKIRGLAWIMKSTRNWITHNSTLFSALDETMVAYLFIINLRLMFSFDEAVQPYEKILLDLFAEEALSAADLKVKTSNKLIPFSKSYLDLKNIVLDEKNNHVQDGFYFNELANNIQQSKSSFRNDKTLFSKLLYQMFWLSTSNPFISTGNRRNLLEIKFWDFNYSEKPYLFELARHIYHPSFSVEK